jgi:hypothetical protein
MLWSIIRESDDNLADVRISLGLQKSVGSYLVFRGEPKDVIYLLELALKEAKRQLPSGNYSDKRGRPQG